MKSKYLGTEHSRASDGEQAGSDREALRGQHQHGSCTAQGNSCSQEETSGRTFSISSFLKNIFSSQYYFNFLF